MVVWSQFFWPYLDLEKPKKHERQKNPVCSAKIQFPMLSDRTLMETIVQ